VSPVDEARRARREAVVREHMDSENVQDWSRTMATFSHPRYELFGEEVHDGPDEVLRYWVEGRKVVPDQRNELIELTHLDEENVLIEFWLRGTPTTTGTAFELRLWAIFGFDQDDLITGERVFRFRPG
jgi:hypothetical protein